MQKVYPTLRITDYEKSKAFYVDGLGSKIEGEHRFAPHLPVFMTISRDELSLYLSQHAGDCQAGGLVFLYVLDVDSVIRRRTPLRISCSNRQCSTPISAEITF